ncbi:MAG: DJ-1/PfpI family protein [Gammaproteobacteria bacterium]|nr:DJ-1/PfpI family protein [Gammaproteobacteria bacterium]
MEVFCTNLVQQLPHKVIMLAYPNAQILDITGPLEVFSRASRWLQDNAMCNSEAYTVEIVSPVAGNICCSNGINLVASRSYREITHADTLLITGGIGFKAQLEDQQLIDWIKTLPEKTQRFGSVCTGAFLLAAAGLLENKIATTHWEYCQELAQFSPSTHVDPDIMFARQGKLYTSAGVTAGIDMALAMVEKDWGQNVALETAQQLVMYLKRPAGQSQFSSQLCSQKSEIESIQKLLIWIIDNPNENLSVVSLADKVAMSPRNFARRFVEETGTTPAKFVEQVRFDIACRKLEETRQSLETIANKTGFRSSESLRRAFVKKMGVTPSDYRTRLRDLENV